MHHHRNGGGPPLSTRNAAAPPPVDRVCGLGVCDVLRVEFELCQVPSLRSEIEELRATIGEAIATLLDRGDEADLDRLGYELQVLDMIARQLDQVDDHVVVCGPARLMGEIITGATRDAAAGLTEQLGQRSRECAGLRDAAELATAWVETYAATHAVEEYSFDPAFDDIRP
jgi:hypothetical protein